MSKEAREVLKQGARPNMARNLLTRAAEALPAEVDVVENPGSRSRGAGRAHRPADRGAPCRSPAAPRGVQTWSLIWYRPTRGRRDRLCGSACDLQRWTGALSAGGCSGGALFRGAACRARAFMIVLALRGWFG
eukprot:7674959-Alexandrium_andersonii.AAC.1